MDSTKSYPTVRDDALDEMVLQAKDYAMAHGIVMRTNGDPENADIVSYAPFVLLPTTVPQTCFDAAKSVQKHFDILVHKIAHDYAFLQETLASTVQVDDFTRRLWQIYETVHKEGLSQPYTLALNRCDYMFDCDPEGCIECVTKTSIKLIEINTIACSFGGLSQHVSDLHTHMLQILNEHDKLTKLRDNKAADGLGAAMCRAWKCYNNPQSVILFLINPAEVNVFDQKHVEYSILEASEYRVRVIRRTLSEVSANASLTHDKRLMLDGMEIAIVYKRSGYTPDIYTEKDWETRLMMERSKAIKCPSVSYQLTGTKKVQQVLAKPGVVERFIKDPQAVKEIRRTFVGQFSLDMDAEGDANTAMAIGNPSKYVLKPQREGGGNNFFGDDVRSKLKELSGTDERSAYVLMERVWPVQVHNYPVRVGCSVERSKMVSELGVFGTLVGTQEVIEYTSQEGHILRTKSVGTDEGGISTGYSVLDSPLLITPDDPRQLTHCS